MTKTKVQNGKYFSNKKYISNKDERTISRKL